MRILLWPAGLVRSSGHVQNWQGYVPVAIHLVAKSAALVMHVYVAIQSVPSALKSYQPVRLPGGSLPWATTLS